VSGQPLTTPKGSFVSEQNPQQPPPYGQAFGSAPGGAQSAGPAPAGPQSFGPAPGGDQTFGQAPEAAAPPEKKKKGIGRIVVSVVVLAAIAAGAWWFSRDNAVNAKVGDCFEESVATETLTDASGTTTIACTDAKAKFKVVGVVDGKTYAQMDVNTDCAQWPTAAFGLWLGETGKAGKVFCLEDIKA
jgi:hypothetical protein